MKEEKGCFIPNFIFLAFQKILKREHDKSNLRPLKLSESLLKEFLVIFTSSSHLSWNLHFSYFQGKGEKTASSLPQIFESLITKRSPTPGVDKKLIHSSSSARGWLDLKIFWRESQQIIFQKNTISPFFLPAQDGSGSGWVKRGNGWLTSTMVLNSS